MITHLHGALEVDLQQHIAAGREVIQRRSLGRSVVVAVDLRVFEIFIAIQAPEELLLVDVIVCLALVIPRLLGTRGDAYRVTDVHPIGEPARDGTLSHAGWTDKDNEQAMFPSGLSHDPK